MRPASAVNAHWCFPTVPRRRQSAPMDCAICTIAGDARRVLRRAHNDVAALQPLHCHPPESFGVSPKPALFFATHKFLSPQAVAITSVSILGFTPALGPPPPFKPRGGAPMPFVLADDRIVVLSYFPSDPSGETGRTRAKSPPAIQRTRLRNATVFLAPLWPSHRPRFGYRGGGVPGVGARLLARR